MSTRISTAQIFDGSRAHVSDAHAKEASTAEKASTFKEVVRPDQNPSNWVRAANLKDDVAIRDSVAKNSSLAQHVLTATENALSQIQEFVQRAHELALSASGTTSGSETARRAILTEVQNLYEGALQAANSRYADRSLLAGMRTQVPAFDKEGKFLGDNNKIEIEAERGQLVPINVSGEQAMLGVGLKNGADIISAFQRLITGLSTDDTEMIQGTLDDLGKGNEQLSLMRSEVGAHMNQIGRANDANETNKIQTLDSISQLEDADAIKVFTDLSKDQTVLKAAVATTQKLLSENPSDLLFK